MLMSRVNDKMRVNFIDIAKGICIFLLVYHHIVTGGHGTFRFHSGALFTIERYLGVFREPLFFFCSGLFFSVYDGFKTFLVKKINKLLVPFFSFYMLISVPKMWLHDHLGVNSVFAFLAENFYNQPLWFLWCLFLCYMVF